MVERSINVIVIVNKPITSVCHQGSSTRQVRTVGGLSYPYPKLVTELGSSFEIRKQIGSQMKVAEALSLRKELNREFDRLTTGGTASYTTPFAKTWEKTMGLMESPQPFLEEVKGLAKPAMMMIGAAHHTSRCLTTLDDIIQQSNCTTIIQLPTSVDLDYAAAGQHVSTTRSVNVNDALLLGKHAKVIVALLTVMVNSGMKEPKISKSPLPGANTANLEKVQIQYNSFDLAEATRVLDFWRKSLRSIDMAIQQANWTTDVDVPQFVSEAYDLDKHGRLLRTLKAVVEKKEGLQAGGMDNIPPLIQI